MKVCSKCKQEKEESCFGKSCSTRDGLQPKCKECRAAYVRENKEKIAETRAAYYKENKAASSDRMRKYYLANCEDIKARVKANNEAKDPEEARATRRAYVQANKDKLRRDQLDYTKSRRKSDALFALKLRVRCLVGQAIRGRGGRKNAKTFEILGCTAVEFMQIMGETPEGCHLDHICPMAQAVTEEEVLKLNHFSNFRWLPAEENQAKSDNWTTEGEQKCLELLNRPWNHKGDDNGS